MADAVVMLFHNGLRIGNSTSHLHACGTAVKALHLHSAQAGDQPLILLENLLYSTSGGDCGDHIAESRLMGLYRVDIAVCFPPRMESSNVFACTASHGKSLDRSDKLPGPLVEFTGRADPQCAMQAVPLMQPQNMVCTYRTLRLCANHTKSVAFVSSFARNTTMIESIRFEALIDISAQCHFGCEVMMLYSGINDHRLEMDSLPEPALLQWKPYHH